MWSTQEPADLYPHQTALAALLLPGVNTQNMLSKYVQYSYCNYMQILSIFDRCVRSKVLPDIVTCSSIQYHLDMCLEPSGVVIGDHGN